jgi:hypothetical protein
VPQSKYGKDFPFLLRRCWDLRLQNVSPKLILPLPFVLEYRAIVFPSVQARSKARHRLPMASCPRTKNYVKVPRVRNWVELFKQRFISLFVSTRPDAIFGSVLIWIPRAQSHLFIATLRCSGSSAKSDLVSKAKSPVCREPYARDRAEDHL